MSDLIEILNKAINNWYTFDNYEKIILILSSNSTEEYIKQHLREQIRNCISNHQEIFDLTASAHYSNTMLQFLSSAHLNHLNHLNLHQLQSHFVTNFQYEYSDLKASALEVTNFIINSRDELMQSILPQFRQPSMNEYVDKQLSKYSQVVVCTDPIQLNSSQFLSWFNFERFCEMLQFFNQRVLVWDRLNSLVSITSDVQYENYTFQEDNCVLKYVLLNNKVIISNNQFELTFIAINNIIIITKAYQGLSKCIHTCDLFDTATIHQFAKYVHQSLIQMPDQNEHSTTLVNLNKNKKNATFFPTKEDYLLFKINNKLNLNKESEIVSKQIPNLFRKHNIDSQKVNVKNYLKWNLPVRKELSTKFEDQFMKLRPFSTKFNLHQFMNLTFNSLTNINKFHSQIKDKSKIYFFLGQVQPFDCPINKFVLDNQHKLCLHNISCNLVRQYISVNSPTIMSQVQSDSDFKSAELEMIESIILSPSIRAMILTSANIKKLQLDIIGMFQRSSCFTAQLQDLHNYIEGNLLVLVDGGPVNLRFINEIILNSSISLIKNILYTIAFSVSAFLQNSLATETLINTLELYPDMSSHNLLIKSLQMQFQEVLQGQWTVKLFSYLVDNGYYHQQILQLVNSKDQHLKLLINDFNANHKLSQISNQQQPKLKKKLDNVIKSNILSNKQKNKENQTIFY